jgi:formate dehydrogenase maturation protein FdhE
MSNKNPISSRQYIKHGAVVCPVCKSSNISADTVDTDGMGGSSNVECRCCGSCWTDVWKVIGYDNLNEGMDVDQLSKILAKAKVEREAQEKVSS